MTSDPYELLGVKRDASQKDIQAAYRKLAKKLHPDLNPGDKAAEEKFKSVSAAYALLQDEEKRARFDKGEIDGSGAEQAAPRSYYRDYAAQPGAASERYSGTDGFSDFGSADDIFASFFSRQGRSRPAAGGGDLRYSMEISLRDAANGGKHQITLPNGPTLDLQIPAGTRDGQTLRLRGKGVAGSSGSAAGDALIDITIAPDVFFRLDGDDIRMDVPISLREAVLGGKVAIPTLSGQVSVTLPPHSNSGKTLRLRGKGFPTKGGKSGDAYVTLTIKLPDQPDPALTAFMTDWVPGNESYSRTDLGE